MPELPEVETIARELNRALSGKRILDVFVYREKNLVGGADAFREAVKGKEILDNFGEYLPKFKKIIPHDYERMLKLIVQMEEKGLSAEQAQIEAFYANQKNKA